MPNLTYFSSQFALPHLRKTKGNIINMSSLVAQIGQPGAVAYVASKVINILTFYNHACSAVFSNVPIYLKTN